MEDGDSPEVYGRLKKFLTEEMRQSHIYQPLMLKELLQSGGAATTEAIARAILEQDPTQVDYYSTVVKNMVGRVLTRNRKITTKDGDRYRIEGAERLTHEQVEELVTICDERIAGYLKKRGDDLWEHRRRGRRPVSGSVRYEVLARAAFRCELCGVSADEKNLEVDHIRPRSLGGKDGLENYQALCYSCNAAKRNTDDRDFRGLNTLYDHRDDGCLFCRVQQGDAPRIVSQNSLAFAVRDAFPVTPLHTLVIPKRHVPDYFGLKQPEVNAIHQLIAEQREVLLREDAGIEGFNVGSNSGEVAGQSVFHCHIHIIPRRCGDVPEPRGGVRNLIPGKGSY